jgi:hypothetical protein
MDGSGPLRQAAHLTTTFSRLALTQPGADKVKNSIGHLHLFPGSHSSRDGEGPENKQADSADCRFIEPFSSSNFDRQRVICLMEQNV